MTGTLDQLLIRRNDCRLCGTPFGEALMSFKGLPVAGAYVVPGDPAPHPILPLTLVRCSSCNLVQLCESLAPSFYAQYSFMSGVAPGYKNYLAIFAEQLGEYLPEGSHVLEIGCSDGTLLQLMERRGFPVAGFEPATSPAQAARAKGLTVVNDFFNVAAAAESKLEPADVVIVRHVLEHMDDFPAIFQGLDAMTTPDATLVIEVPDLPSTIDASIYSNIYHIHPCYFDVDTMSALLFRYGWETKGATIVDIFGGSLLLWATRAGSARKDGWNSRLSFEAVTRGPALPLVAKNLGLFLSAWKEAALTIRRFFDELKAANKRVAGCGAAERTSSLMGVAGLDSSHIAAVFDQNPNLIGKALPGSGVPIRSPGEISDLAPEYLAIFAQSFEEEIMREQAAFHVNGGRFISLKSGVPVVLS